MTILEHIRQPHDQQALSETQLGELSPEIREFLVPAVREDIGHQSQHPQEHQA